jgi:WD40 repeat protein
LARVFLSHAGDDRVLAESVFGWLSGDGHEVFYSRDPLGGIPVGAPWRERLYGELSRVDAVVCLLTTGFVASMWCTAEVAIADSRGCVVIPWLAEDGVSHELIDRRQYTSVDREAARAQVLARLRQLDANGRSQWREGDNPYPGMEPFTAELNALFFGRAREIRNLAARLRAPAGRDVIAVAGPSGCGKSSLLQAGLLPMLAEDSGWLVLEPWSPGDDPVYALAKAVRITALRHQVDWSVEEIADRLVRPRGLREFLDELLIVENSSAGRRVLVAIDQAEELFGVAVTAEQRASVGALLGTAIAGGARLVLTVRSEFLDDLGGLPSLPRDCIEPYLLGPLDRDMLRLAIEKPARIAGLRLEPELSARLIADTDSGEALPLLAFALHQLAEGLSRGESLTVEAYDSLGDGELGGLHGVLVGHADGALDAARRRSGVTGERILAGLVRMVSVDAEGRWARRSVDQAKLGEAMRIAVGVLVDQRLLTTDGPNGFVRFTHEALLTAWPPLAGVVEEHGKALRTARLVERAAGEWVAADRADGYLWEDEERVTATMVDLGYSSALDRYAIELDDSAREFLNTTRERIIRARRRARFRLVRAVVVLSVLLVITLIAGAVAVVQANVAQHERDAATVRGLLARADAVRDADPKLALRLGLAARSLAGGGGDIDANLVHTLTAGNYAATLSGYTAPVDSAAFSPDQRLLATGGDGTFRLWDVSDLHAPKPLSKVDEDQSRGTWTAAFSSHDSTLLAIANPGQLELWDISDPRNPHRRGSVQLTAADEQTSPAIGTGMAFSPDGRYLAVTDDLEMTLWNVERPDQPRIVARWSTGTRVLFGDVAFNSDGTAMAAVLSDDTKGTLRLWDLSDPDYLRPTSTVGITDGVPTTLAFHPGGRTLAVARTIGSSERGVLDLWDITSLYYPHRTGVPLTGHIYRILDTAFSPDGHTLATAGQDDIVMLWDTTDPTRPQPLGDPLTEHSDWVHAVSFAKDGAMATASEDGTVVLWAPTNPARPRPLDLPELNHPDAILALGFGPDNSSLAASSLTGPARLWDVSDPTKPRGPGTLPDDHGPITALAFQPTGALLATGNGSGTTEPDAATDANQEGAVSEDRPSSVLLWDIHDPTNPHRVAGPLDGSRSSVAALHFSADGRTLWSADHRVSLFRWNVTNSAHPVRTAESMTDRTDYQPSITFRPDNRAIASGTGKSGAISVVVRDITDPNNVHLLQTPMTDHRAHTMLFGPDGTLLATGGADVLLWDLTTAWQPRRYGSPLGAGNTVRALALSTDGHTLVVGDADGVITLWDVTDRPLPFRIGTPLTRHQHAITALAISPNGRLLASGDESGIVTLWDLSRLQTIRDHTVDEACARADGFTTDEWTRHVAPTIPYRQTCPNTPTTRTGNQ